MKIAVIGTGISGNVAPIISIKSTILLFFGAMIM